MLFFQSDQVVSKVLELQQLMETSIQLYNSNYDGFLNSEIFSELSEELVSIFPEAIALYELNTYLHTNGALSKFFSEPLGYDREQEIADEITSFVTSDCDEMFVEKFPDIDFETFENVWDAVLNENSRSEITESEAMKRSAKISSYIRSVANEEVPSFFTKQLTKALISRLQS